MKIMRAILLFPVMVGCDNSGNGNQKDPGYPDDPEGIQYLGLKQELNLPAAGNVSFACGYEN